MGPDIELDHGGRSVRVGGGGDWHGQGRLWPESAGVTDAGDGVREGHTTWAYAYESAESREQRRRVSITRLTSVR